MLHPLDQTAVPLSTWWASSAIHHFNPKVQGTRPLPHCVKVFHKPHTLQQLIPSAGGTAVKGLNAEGGHYCMQGAEWRERRHRQRHSTQLRRTAAGTRSGTGAATSTALSRPPASWFRPRCPSISNNSVHSAVPHTKATAPPLPPPPDRALDCEVFAKANAKANAFAMYASHLDNHVCPHVTVGHGRSGAMDPQVATTDPLMDSSPISVLMTHVRVWPPLWHGMPQNSQRAGMAATPQLVRQIRAAMSLQALVTSRVAASDRVIKQVPG